MSRDPYVYPGTSVLRNKENIRDLLELEAFERIATANRMETLSADIPITVGGYGEIHRYIFQDIYDWAGQDRTIEIARRESLFCMARYVDEQLTKRFDAIHAETDLHGLGRTDFAERAAVHICELNAIHPFRDGNGRTLRAFLFILGRQAGHEIDLAQIEPHAWNEASRQSFRSGHWRPMAKAIAGATEK